MGMAMLNDIDARRLRDFLELKTGIFIDDEKLRKIYKRKYEEFMQKNGFDNFYALYSQLVHGKDSKLLQEFINLSTVNETYFFREAYQFDTLVEEVLPKLHQIRPLDESINILAAPSSSGEELYSIAIYIMEKIPQIFAKRDFVLVGIDIDSSMIKKAKEGLYTKRSIAKLPSHILLKYFKQKGNLFEIDKQLRDGLTFKVVNVLDFYAMKRLGKFDVIFSRNMLIYFDEKTKQKILATFHALLKPQGYLFLGHAEKVPFDMKIFRRVKIGKSILYQKVENVS